MKPERTLTSTLKHVRRCSKKTASKQNDRYTELEKLQIAKRHLIPRQLTGHGLDDRDVTFMDEAVRKIIGDYTREAGVRQLERHVGAVCRKAIVKLTTKTWEHVMVTPELVADYLKKKKFEKEVSEVIKVPDISTGLAVTSVGGDILFVEATRMDGNRKLTVTLRGRVLPVGGIKMKILAVHRAGLKTVILPKRNEKDLEDATSEVHNTMDFVLVERIDDAIEAALMPTGDGISAADSNLDRILKQPEIEFSPVSALSN
jgi:ATP-dependent Lon protease